MITKQLYLCLIVLFSLHMRAEESTAYEFVAGAPLVYAIDRISDEDIAGKEKKLIEEFEKNRTMRVACAVSGGVVGTVGVGLALYRMIIVRKVVRDFEVEDMSLVELRPLVRELLNRVRVLEGGPRFGSWKWYKNFVWHIVLSPSTILDLGHGVIKRIKHQYAKVFHPMTVQWYINNRTTIGALKGHGEEYTLHHEFEKGVTFKEFINSATVLDGESCARLPIDCEYHKFHLVQLCEKSARELIGIMAFMRCFAEVFDLSERAQSEITSCERYILNCYNVFAGYIEEILPHKCREPLVPLVQTFISDMEQTIIRLADIYPLS